MAMKGGVTLEVTPDDVKDATDGGAKKGTATLNLGADDIKKIAGAVAEFLRPKSTNCSWLRRSDAVACYPGQ